MKASKLNSADAQTNDWWDPELNPQGERLAEAGAPSESPLERGNWKQWALLAVGLGMLVFGLPQLKRALKDKADSGS